MDYIKTGTMAYNLHIIKTNKFKKVVVRVNFRRKFDKEGITYRKMLAEVLLESTKKYPTAREMSLKYEDLYSASLAYNTLSNGLYGVISFQLSVLNDQYTEEGNMEKAISFLSEVLFEPNVKEEQFDSPSFKRCKDFLKELIELKDENPEQYANRRFLETMFPDSNLQYIGPGYLEDLETITEASLYEYYKSVLNSDLVDIFVCGDVDPEQIEALIQEKFPIHTFKKPSNSLVIEQTNFRKRSQTVTEKRDIKQSRLIVGCKLLPMTEFEQKYTSKLYSYILGGSGNSLLFKTVREKHSLCYTISSNVLPTKGYLKIASGLDGDQSKKAVTLIKKAMKDLRDGNFESSQIEDFKMITKTLRKEIFDSAINTIDFYQLKEYTGIDDYEVMEKEIEKLDKEAVKEFGKKVKLDTIYLLEGGSVDE